ncbi:UDP-glucuronate 4-epimerase [Methylorubrum rhodesianum]|uniref:NAD-dependent epimerase/dehydratase family protein n=1 Tax=Methylorubrum TaxID=2282523 RepID=UPI001622D99A|nr:MULTISPECIES: NAD-dependent epimerase/dehydratase family protein [Methylorubrum]MBB5765743.1 UDP-glucuronate 4-epimerase [Methylorubrum rhodesianum]MBI1691993.1 NAD-dependent epimerase/dehydratase family protein [Methylorubrum sp. DB1722]
MRTVLVTGVAGFVGSHVAHRLLHAGDAVVGVDNFNAYYDPALKEHRISSLEPLPGFTLVRMDFADAEGMSRVVREHGIRHVVHLGAQAGVRYSLEKPFEYEKSNLAGHLSVLEACRHAPDFEHLVYASSSSVYGHRPASGVAFRESDRVDEPVSLYAATKRACELISSTYGHLYGIPQSGLRFFTVYGPAGRPDMAYYSFTQKILRGEPIEIFGEGNMERDFTYIDDVVDGVVGVLDRPPERGVNNILNIGNDRPERLLDFVRHIEEAVGREARMILRPMQPGDVVATWADITKIRALIGYEPKTTLATGLPKFVEWYRSYAR